MQPLWKTVWKFLKKLKMEISYDPVITLLGIYQKYKNCNSKGYMHFIFTAVLFIISKIW